MKLILRLSLALLVSAAILASVPWQSAIIIETAKPLSVTGFDNYPQIGLFLGLQLVAIFGARYWSKTASRAAGAIVALFSLLAIIPIASALAAGEPRLLQVAIEKATGISDWSSQLETVQSLQTNLPAMYGIVSVMLLLVTSNILGLFTRRAAKPEQQTDWLN
jgi:hypothetical protein